MSTFLLACSAAFLLVMVHALVITGWRSEFAKAWHAERETDGQEAVKVSLVIPARDAANTLGTLLQDLHAQQWPKELLEVIVVDDASTDGTAEIVRSMMRTWPGLRLVISQGEGKKAAITHGVNEAGGEWLVLTDADARCGPKRIARIMEAVATHAPDILLMPVETLGNGSFLQTLQADEQAALLGAAAGMALQGRPLLANGANMAFRKHAFLAVGGYAGDKWASGDDVILLRRMLKAGKHAAYLLHPDVLVTVQAENGMRAFWRQRLRWAGKMRGVGGSWFVIAALLLPWFLLIISTAFGVDDWLEQSPSACFLLLATAWLLWLLPILALVREVRAFLHAAYPAQRIKAPMASTLFSYVAFHVYAPVVALGSLFWRPVWKGRRI